MSGATGSKYRPHTWTLLFIGGAFLIVLGMAFRAVQIADSSRDDARQDAQEAKLAVIESQEKLNDLQNQNNCVIKAIVKVSKANLNNSLAQDRLLLSGFRGGNNDSINTLAETEQNLVSVLEELQKTEEDCKP